MSFTINTLSIHRHWARWMVGAVLRLLLPFLLLLPLFPLFVVVLSLLVLLLVGVAARLLTRRQVLRNVIVIFMLLILLLVFPRRRRVEDAILFRKLRVKISLEIEFQLCMSGHLQVHWDASESRIVGRLWAEPTLCHRSEAYRSRSEVSCCPTKWQNDSSGHEIQLGLRTTHNDARSIDDARQGR